MNPSPSLLRVALLASAWSLPLAAVAAAPSNQIVVSAANYAQTPPEVLAKMFRDPADLTEAPPPPAPPATVRYYQFLPGERLAADLSYVEVCQLLVPALAEKNLRNTHDAAKVELILRVTFGGRRWRDPFVRKDYLEWRHGLVPRKLGDAFAAATGTARAWDDRAGGDDASLYQLERDLAEMDPTNGAEGMADRLINGQPTEDYHLIVVDAFEVAQLKKLGNKAPRAWSTFIAVPARQSVKFSDVAAAMIARAAPYFGETLPGKVRFTDREGKVTAGELRVIEENVPAPKK
jgi:hypothetical protein